METEIVTDQAEETTDQSLQDATQTPAEAVDVPVEVESTTDAVEDATGTPEAFPRSYVEKLRKENAGYRERAQRSDDLAQRLHTALVTATGKLADATDLPFTEEHLEDPEALNRAIQSLLTDKPHLASRKPRGSIGQGATGAADTVDLAGLLRARAS